MFAELLVLLERFVVAHERIAEAIDKYTSWKENEASELLNRAKNTMSVLENAANDLASEDNEPTETVPDDLPSELPADPAPPEDPPPPPAPPADEWNPLTAEVQGRYGAGKAAILDAFLQNNGIKVKASANNPEKHRAIKAWQVQVAQMAEQPDQVPPTGEGVDQASDPEVTPDLYKAKVRHILETHGERTREVIKSRVAEACGTFVALKIPQDKLPLAMSTLDALDQEYTAAAGTSAEEEGF